MRQYLHRLMSLRLSSKKNFFFTKMSVKTKKKSGKTLRKSGKSQGKIREFDGIKKVGTPCMSL